MSYCEQLSKEEVDQITKDPSWVHHCGSVTPEDIEFLKAGGCLAFDVNNEYSLFVCCVEDE